MRISGVVQRRLAALERTDPPGAAAYALRHQQICPRCRVGRASVTVENAVTSLRTFRCRDCGWTAEITESQWRGSPQITLRPLVLVLMAERCATGEAAGAIQAGAAVHPAETGSRWG